MGKRGFIAFDPVLAREKFNADIVIAIYYAKLLRYDQILSKDGEGFFTRSNKEIEEATCITRRQQERVRKWLMGHNYLLTTLKIPDGDSAPQLHYKIIDSSVRI